MLNFSIAYGKTAHGLSKDWGVSIKEAEDTLKRWYADRPEVSREGGACRQGVPPFLRAGCLRRHPQRTPLGGRDSPHGKICAPQPREASRGRQPTPIQTPNGRLSPPRPAAQVLQWQEETRQYARDHGYVNTMLGRRRNLRPAINSSRAFERSRAERAAINTPIQGSAADVAAAAMLAIARDAWLQDNGWKLLLQVRAWLGGGGASRPREGGANGRRRKKPCPAAHVLATDMLARPRGPPNNLASNLQTASRPGPPPPPKGSRRGDAGGPPRDRRARARRRHRGDGEPLEEPGRL